MEISLSVRELLVSYEVPAIVLPGYLLVTFILHHWMKNRQPFVLKDWLSLHNLILCVVSLLMAVFTTIEILKRLIKADWNLYEIYCPQDLGDREGESWLWFWCFVFYASKYYELLDTVFIVLKKKPLIFLHVYHHFIIVFLCLFMMRQKMIFFFSGVIINAAIHTFMYWYYFASLKFGSEPWWKKHLTKGQIFQFMWGTTSWWAYPFVCSNSRENVPQYDLWIWWFNQFVLISFLVLFMNFFVKTYKSPQKTQLADLKNGNHQENGYKTENGHKKENGYHTENGYNEKKSQ